MTLRARPAALFFSLSLLFNKVVFFGFFRFLDGTRAMRDAPLERVKLFGRADIGNQFRDAMLKRNGVRNVVGMEAIDRVEFENKFVKRHYQCTHRVVHHWTRVDDERVANEVDAQRRIEIKQCVCCVATLQQHVDMRHQQP